MDPLEFLEHLGFNALLNAALSKLVADGTLQIGNEKNIDQVADEVLDSIVADIAKGQETKAAAAF